MGLVSLKVGSMQDVEQRFSELMEEGERLTEEARYEESAAVFGQALELRPGDADALMHLGYAEECLGEARAAEEHYRASLAQRELPGLWARVGSLALAEQRYEAARAAAERALALSDETAEAHDVLARVLWETDELQEALRHAQQAAEVEPESEHYALTVAYAFLLLDDLARADEWYRRAAEVEPAGAWTWARLGWVRLLAGDSERAGEPIRIALELNPEEPEALRGKAWLLRQADDPEGAVDCGRRAVELEPEDSRNHEILGLALGDLERWEEAVEALQECVRLWPDGIEGRNELAWALLALDRFEEAEEQYRAVATRDEEDVEAWESIGWCRECLADYAGAEHYYRTALRLDPQYTRPLCFLVRLLLALGRAEEAAIAAAGWPAEALTPELRAALAAATGDLAQAKAELTAGRAAEPAEPMDPLTIGLAYELLGLRAEAREQYTRALGDGGSSLADLRLGRLGDGS